MQVVGAVEGSRAAAVRACVQASVGVCGEVAVQLAQLIVRFVTSGVMTDVRAIGGGDDGWGDGRRRLLDDRGGGDWECRRQWDERL